MAPTFSPTKLLFYKTTVAMKKILLCLFIIAAVGVCAQRTTRKGLKAENTASATASAATVDTIDAPPAHTVDINGYDKPLRSSRETFFATNNGKQTIAGMAFTITYLDSSGRQLHKAHHNTSSEIPAGETRQIAVRSWDKQQSFYYTRSTVPVRASQATPYDVKIEIDTIFVR